MVSAPKRNLGLAVLLILALLTAWSHETLAHHNHDGLHPDPFCTVCRTAENPGQTVSSGAIPTGIPVIDLSDGPAPGIVALPPAPCLSSRSTRAPPIA